MTVTPVRTGVYDNSLAMVLALCHGGAEANLPCGRAN